MLRFWVPVILLGTSAVCAMAQPRAEASREPATFCVVPVKDGAPTEADIGSSWRITNTTHRVPGLPALVFTPINRKGQWTIDGDRRLVPYTGPFPHSYLDRNSWISEPWSGRVVAITWGGGVSVLRPRSDRFERLQGDKLSRGSGSYRSVQILPRRKMTIVMNGRGLPFAVEDNALRPWLTPQQMAAQNIRAISRLLDSPALSATIVVDSDGWLHVLSDDDRWQRLSSIKPDTHGRVFEDTYSGRVLFLGAKTVVSISKNTNGSFSAERLLTTSANGADRRFHVTALLGQVLSYDGGGMLDRHQRWRRLAADGFEDIPGGDIGVAGKNFPRGRTHDLPSLAKVLIEGHDGLFLYDGRTVVRVAGSSPQRIGELPRVYDLASLKRVLVTTRDGLFELTADGALVPRPMPFTTSGLPLPALKDWPESGVALVSTREGLFTLDAALNATAVEAGHLVGLSWLEAASGTNPATGEMVLTGSRGLFLAVDGRRNPDVCDRAREAVPQFAESNICTRPIASTDVSDIGFAAGGIVEAPEGSGILIDTVRGLFLLDAADKVTPLQTRDGQFTRSLMRLPWSGEVAAVGVLETVIARDLSITMLDKWRFSRLIGAFPSIQSILLARDSGKAVQLARIENGRYQIIDTRLSQLNAGAIVDAPWFGAPIIKEWKGLFSLDRDGQTRPFAVEGLPSGRAGAGAFSTLPSGYGSRTFFAVPRFRTIYLWRGGWHRITRERRWLPLDGLATDVSVLTDFDPGSGEVLFGTSRGVVAVGAEGQIRRLAGEVAPLRAIRAIGASARPGVVLAGGDEGLFEIRTGTLEVERVKDGADDIIGSVRRIVSLPFANVDVIEASNGTYELSEGRLHLIRDLSTAGSASGVTGFDTVKRALAKAARQEGALLFELARRDAAGACTAALERVRG